MSTSENFCKKLGISFKSQSLLEQALTHSSLKQDENNERLEFLGDRVLSLVLAHALFTLFRDESEGELAKRHASLVRGELLADIGREIGLPEIIKIGGEASNINTNIIADAFEALVGALYLDSGYPPCEKLILQLWAERLAEHNPIPEDPKTSLQEWAQKLGKGLPLYEITKREGPDHAPVFTISVSVKGLPSMQGIGASRRLAEKEAAKNLLAHIQKS
ncbi:MAG: ribonuclease III [Alphaproteobacteria bacterium]|nr:ribonuclease III [Alphaproteobacteria bacterium]